MVNDDHLYCLRFHCFYTHFINTLELVVPGTGDTKVWAPLLSISNAVSPREAVMSWDGMGRGGERFGFHLILPGSGGCPAGQDLQLPG